jgi:hypothetical protein
MGLRAVQEKRYADVREMTGNDDEQNWLPPFTRPASEIGHYNSSIYCATTIIACSKVILRNLAARRRPANQTTA